MELFKWVELFVPVEVVEDEELSEGPVFITEVEMPLDSPPPLWGELWEFKLDNGWKFEILEVGLELECSENEFKLKLLDLEEEILKDESLKCKYRR